MKTSIFISSVSAKVPLLSLLRKRLPEYRLVGGDVSPSIIGRFFVDVFWQMPPLSELTYEMFIDYCKVTGIRYVLPTRDRELVYYAKWAPALAKEGIFVMVSTEEALIRASDKLRFSQYLLGEGYPVIPAVRSLQALEDPYIVLKERYGSGSTGIHLNVPLEQASSFMSTLKEPIIQPFIHGREYSIDVYMTRLGEAKGAIVRERVVVVDGESQVTTTVRNESLEQLAMNVAESLELYGHVMFQVIVDDANRPHIVECNPRFGGASSLSVEAGLDSFYWFILESKGQSLADYPFTRVERELTQVRYAKDLIF